METQITQLSATEIGSRIASGSVSAREVVEAHLERIEEINPWLNAVVQICGDRALREADMADKEISDGNRTGALQGVPMTLKDSLDTEGVISTWGTLGRKGYVPDKDAVLVSRLRREGAILLGKTNTPELTLAADTNNLIYGRTANPYDEALSPGGSSGGAAAIIASAGSPFDIGSDTGGSIRIPSHCCGIAGIKPTSGRVPRTGHCISYALGAGESLTQNGPMARRVGDLFPVLKTIAGPDFEDPAIVPMPLRNPEDVTISGLRIAVHTDNGLMSPTEDIKDVVLKAASVLESEGAEITEVKPEALEMIGHIDSRNSTGDGRAWVRRILDNVGTDQYSTFIKNRLEDAHVMETSDFTEVLELVDVYRSRMIRFMSDYDVIVCPASARPAIQPGASFLPENKFLYSYTSAFNVTGWPAGVVRGGSSEEGLPVAVQVVGRPWREDVVLAVLEVVERETSGWIEPNF